MVTDTDSGLLFRFPHHCGIGDFRRFIAISHTVTSRLLRHLADADKRMKPHFGSDPADIRIRIWINPEIQIRIQDHFWLRV